MLTCWNGLFLPQMDDRYRMWRAVRENICSSRTGVILMLYMDITCLFGNFLTAVGRDDKGHVLSIDIPHHDCPDDIKISAILCRLCG